MNSALMWVAATSLAGFLLMGRDKLRAMRGGWRTPERFLLIVAILGGSPGVYFGMRFFRHKTLRPLFRLGVPAILVAQALCFWLLFRR
ncbi:MAG: DUF1294 domain-containing protein [Planctomycetota bacterium]|jgi:uncharacterized membrane protein YsdA (DUF1294 family)|nr:DUF1294 domain-containing protein [Planctomycetota bacterium]